MMAEEEKNLYSKATEIITRSEHILIITGAGISAGSGLPTYRGIGGLYNDTGTQEGIPIEEALGGDMLMRRPEITWKYLWQIGSACAGTKFNRGHEIIAEIEKAKPDTWVLTQNIDGFHTDAGSKNVIEIHGCGSKLFCLECGKKFSSSEIVDDYKNPIQLPPKCPDCGGLIRPEVVLFGEALPPDAIDLLMNKANVDRDLVMVIGTSGVFPYISAPALQARSQSIPTIEINPEKTQLSEIVDIHIQEEATTALEVLWSSI